MWKAYKQRWVYNNCKVPCTRCRLLEDPSSSTLSIARLKVAGLFWTRKLVELGLQILQAATLSDGRVSITGHLIPPHRITRSKDIHSNNHESLSHWEVAPVQPGALPNLTLGYKLLGRARCCSWKSLLAWVPRGTWEPSLCRLPTSRFPCEWASSSDYVTRAEILLTQDTPHVDTWFP